VALALLLLAGCGHVVGGSLTTDHHSFDFADHACSAYKESGPEKVQVVTVGSGGVYIRWRDDAILIGPAFSNPGLLRAYGGYLKFDERQIAKASGFEHVRAIFAGHSHYDHIGDIPILTKRYDVPVYVNASGVNMLAAYPQIRTESLKENIPVCVTSFITVTPVISGHATQLCPWHRLAPCRYAEGEVKEPWTTPWTHHRLRTMLGGKTFAFVIDIHDEKNRTRYRIYYNDAAAASPLGQIPAADIDLAILCVAQWNWVENYPEDLLTNVKPRHVLVSHFDNFFRKDEAGFVPNLSNRGVEGFLTKINKSDAVRGSGDPTNKVCGITTSRWTMPVPGSSLLFDPR